MHIIKFALLNLINKKYNTGPAPKAVGVLKNHRDIV